METTLAQQNTASVKYGGQTFNERDIVKLYTILNLIHKADTTGTLCVRFNNVFSKVIPVETLDTFLIRGTELVKEQKKALKRDITLEKQRQKNIDEMNKNLDRKR